MIFLSLITLTAIILIASWIFFVLSRKVFKLDNPNFYKSLKIVVISYILGSLASSFITTIIPFIYIIYNIICVIIVFFIFNYFFRKEYHTSFKKALVVYSSFSIITFIILTAIFLPIRMFIFQPFLVKGEAMEPTFKNDDYVLVYKISKKFSRGDVVIHNFRNKDTLYIKRIIGLPSEKIEIKDGKVYMNEKPINESYINSEKTDGDISVTLADDEYFVLGDNRLPGASSDSRQFGAIKEGYIKGKIIFKLPF